MSLILDALRKIELERKAKHKGSHEIRTEVLNYRGNAPAADRSRILPIAAVFLLIFVAIACFFFLKQGDSPKIEPAPPREITKVETTPVIPVAPPQPLQPPPPEPPAQKGIQRKVNSSAVPVKKSTAAEIIKQKNGDAGISVSGIAWQDERSLRRAVINGFLVGEGAEIQGANIIEIKENRVRFSRNGTVFEIDHSSATGKQP